MGGGPPGFPQGSTCPEVLGSRAPGVPPLSSTGLSPSMAHVFHVVRLEAGFVTPWGVWGLPRLCPTTPARQRPQALAPDRFRLFPFRSPLLRESMSLSFPPGTEMFHFPGCRLHGVLGQSPSPMDDPLLSGPGFPIRASRDHSLSAAPPGLSQLTTPFIASPCRGIHLLPLVAWSLLSCNTT